MVGTKFNSEILKSAVVGGAGLMLGPKFDVVLLNVPLAHIAGKTVPQIQADLELPWSGPDGEPYWFEGNVHLNVQKPKA